MVKSMTDAILQITDLRYARTSGWKVEIDSFTLNSHDFVGIIGANGAGKSTLLRLMGGILQPESGRIDLQAKPIANYNRADIAKVIGYLPQDNSYQFDYTVEKTVEFGRYPHKRGFAGLSRYDREVIEESLVLTDLLPLKHRRLSELSGGERKRVFLAAILALEPKALLLDEPVAALDLHHQSVFFNLLRGLSKKGMAIAVVTHELNLASLFCSQTMLIDNGSIHSIGTPEEILTQQVIHDIYGAELGVYEHPACKTPIILPRGIIQE